MYRAGANFVMIISARTVLSKYGQAFHVQVWFGIIYLTQCLPSQLNMYRRGPYKRYKIDVQNAVPRRTVYYHRRKVGQTSQNENQYGGDILPVSIKQAPSTAELFIWVFLYFLF